MSENTDTLFLEALKLPSGAGRAAFLDVACGNDSDLRRRIEAMLADDTVADAFFEGPATASPSTDLAFVPGEEAGDIIGRFKLLQIIGEGGFGVVWMAEQSEPVKRRVALKIIRIGMDTHEFIARFEQERQALAMMDHPNIARVLDGGATPSGRPYFVMELVRGVPITKFCDEEKLPLTERLKLFVEVCHAIQHAHQKGIIHRDIKPSNILVARGDDGSPMPRVIDFGIAKAMDRTLTDTTLYTQFEQMIGTPAYMSPEQAGSGRLDIDTRSDVYALGVLLYEMLTGRPPFDPKDLMEAGFEEMRRVIREDEPPKPSTCLTSMVRAQLAGLAQSRHTEVPKLVSTMKGDLDWIVMKALEKNRVRRYETANGFADDIGRYLRNEPVIARPPSFGYRAGKFIHKHKGPVTAAAAILVTLLGGLTASTVLYLREKEALGRESTQRAKAESASHKAETESRKNEQTAKFLNDMLAGINPDEAKGADPTLMKIILAKAARRVGNGLQGQPEVEAFLRNTIGSTYFNMGLYPEAQTQYVAGLKVAEEAIGNENRLTLNFRGNLANVMYSLHDYDGAVAEDRAILEIRERVFGPKDPETLATRFNLANALAKLRRHEEAAREYRVTCSLQEAVLGTEAPDTLLSRAALANTMRELATTKQELEVVEAQYREVIAIEERIAGFGPTVILEARYGLGEVLYSLEKYTDAEEVHREVFTERQKILGSPHKKTLQSRSAVARALFKQGRLTEAADEIRAAMQLQKPDADDYLLNRMSLAAILGQGGRHDEAAAELRPLIGSLTKLKTSTDPTVLTCRFNLAAALAGQKNFPEAEQELMAVIEVQQRVLPSGHGDTVRSMETLAEILKADGKVDEAQKWVIRAAELEKGKTKPGT